MNRKPGRGVGGRQPDLNEFEAYLQATLQPVSPRPGFVHALRGRLLSQHENAGQGNSGRPLQMIVFAVAGLATTLLVVVTGVKATVAILGALGLLHQVQQGREAAGQPVPVQPAA